MKNFCEKVKWATVSIFACEFVTTYFELSVTMRHRYCSRHSYSLYPFIIFYEFVTFIVYVRVKIEIGKCVKCIWKSINSLLICFLFLIIISCFTAITQFRICNKQYFFFKTEEKTQQHFKLRLIDLWMVFPLTLVIVKV